MLSIDLLHIPSQAFRKHLMARRLRVRSAAPATITRFVPVFRARLALWSLRAEARRREVAATAIQSAFRGLIQRRRAAAEIRGIKRFQVLGGCGRVSCAIPLISLLSSLSPGCMAGSSCPSRVRGSTRPGPSQAGGCRRGGPEGPSSANWRKDEGGHWCAAGQVGVAITI